VPRKFSQRRDIVNLRGNRQLERQYFPAFAAASGKCGAHGAVGWSVGYPAASSGYIFQSGSETLAFSGMLVGRERQTQRLLPELKGEVLQYAATEEDF